MDEKLKFLLKDILFNDRGATDTAIEELFSETNFYLPADYVDLMRLYNGGEGRVGEDGWITFFPMEDLLTVNKDYRLLMDDIPDYFLFGKDAADTGYAVHKLSKTYHSFGLMSNFKTDKIEFCGNSLVEFLEIIGWENG